MESMSDEDLLQYCTWRSPSMRRTMLECQSLIQPRMRHDPSSRPSSAGNLDALPLELMHIIFSSLDLITLSNICYTSVRGRVLVESLPAFRDLVTHAPGPIAALRRTGLIALHSTAKVHESLLSDRCCVCHDFAPYLYLPSCDRCCLNCLFDQRSLRMIPVSHAQSYFGLKSKDLSETPKLLSVPGTYGSPAKTYAKRMLLVSVKHARAAAIAKYGDEDAMERAIQDADAKKEARHHKRLAIQGQSERQINRSPRRQTAAARILTDPNDRYRFMGATPMPWLSSVRDLEKGVWCLGCHDSRVRFLRQEVHGDDEDRFQEGEVARNRILRRERRAFSRPKFLEHVRCCTGARRWAQAWQARRQG